MQGEGSTGTQSIPSPSADAVQDPSTTEKPACCAKGRAAQGRAALGLIFLIWACPGARVCPLAPVPVRVRHNHREEGTEEGHWQKPCSCPDRERVISMEALGQSPQRKH